MQDKLEIEILKAGVQNLRVPIMKSLNQKSQFIEKAWNSPLNDILFKKIQIETEHVKNCIAFIEAYDNLKAAYEKDAHLLRLKNSTLSFFLDGYINDCSILTLGKNGR
jgi:hypothetical protein